MRRRNSPRRGQDKNRHRALDLLSDLKGPLDVDVQHHIAARCHLLLERNDARAVEIAVDLRPLGECAVAIIRSKVLDPRSGNRPLHLPARGRRVVWDTLNARPLTRARSPRTRVDFPTPTGRR